MSTQKKVILTKIKVIKSIVKLVAMLFVRIKVHVEKALNEGLAPWHHKALFAVVCHDLLTFLQELNSNKAGSSDWYVCVLINIGVCVIVYV